MANAQAVTDLIGSFKPDTLGNLQIKISDEDGDPIDPESVIIQIIDPNGYAIVQDKAEKVVIGFYAYDWYININATTGKYHIQWEYVVDGKEYTEEQYLVVADGSSTTAYYSGPRYILRNSLQQLIGGAMYIPMYREQAKETHDFQTYTFTKDKWNQSPKVKIFRNNIIVNELVEIDYFKGKIVFPDKQLAQDNIEANYTFRWFSDFELDIFIENGIQVLNSYPPFSPMYSAVNIVTQAPNWVPAVLYGGAVDCIRRLMFDLQFQEPQQFFGSDEKAERAFSNFETLKQNYEKRLDKLLENKKLGPYPKTVSVVVPEYTLPGGRSRWFRYLFSGGM